MGCSAAWALGSDTFIRITSSMMAAKYKLDRKSGPLAVVSGLFLVILILGALACLIDFFDPEAVDSHSPVLLLVALVAIPLAFFVYRQFKVWSGAGKPKQP